MLLAYKEICKLIADGTVLGATPELVNGTSLDITLGTSILAECADECPLCYSNLTGKNQGCAVCKIWPETFIVDFKERTPLRSVHVDITKNGYYLRPGEFVLAQSEQVFHLPNCISAEFKLKSSAARVGLTNLLAGWCDPGWHGSVLTMELKNETRYHTIRIRPGDRIGQMVFYRHAPVPEEALYSRRGRYNNDKKVEGIKL